MAEEQSPDSGLDIASIAREAAGLPESGLGAESAPAGDAGGQSVGSEVPGGTGAEFRPLPKSWKKEMEGLWGKLPREVHDYVYEREANVSRGIQSYRDGHETWQSLVQPFQQVFQQHPQVKPRELFQNLMQTHLALSFGSPEQKKALWQQIGKAYGLAEEQAAAPAVDLSPLQQRIQSIEQAFYQQRLAETTAKVEAFFADPKNEFAKDLEDDILEQVRAGERDLAKAYEKAMWLNPKVREKVIAKQRAAAPSPLNLKSGGGASRGSPAPRKGTIDETIDSIVAKHFQPS